MRKYYLGLWLVLFNGWSNLASAASRPPAQCSLVSGILLQLPGKPLFKFKRAQRHNNSYYPLSHTQLFIQDAQGVIVKIVFDNLFYINLTNAQARANRDIGLIADLTHHYPAGSVVEACGKVYRPRNKVELHFVHPSACAKNAFNGFLHIGGSDISANFKYCGACGCS